MASPNASSASLPPLAPKQTASQEKLAPGNPSKPPAASAAAAKSKKVDDEDGTAIEELAMPRTMIARLAKSTLPPNTNLQKDALLALSKSATLFISHLASAAQDDLPPSKKTIQPANVFAALEATEFAFMIPSLQADLEKFIAIQANKREEYKKKLKDGKVVPTVGAGGGGADVEGSTMLMGGDDEDSIADGVVQTRGERADPEAQLQAESAIDRQRSAKRAKGVGGDVVMAAAASSGDEDEEEDDVDMLDAEAGDGEQGDAGEEEDDDDDEDEDEDEDATESEAGSGNDTIPEDGVGTDREEEEEEDDDDDEEEEAGSEEDSD